MKGKFISLVDSGASDNVIPEGSQFVTPTTVRDNEKKGTKFVSATGETTEAQGGVQLKMKTWCRSYQVAGVNKALTSVSKICDEGNTVVFMATGGYIVNNKDQSRTRIHRLRGVYVLSEDAEASEKEERSAPFQGQANGP